MRTRGTGAPDAAARSLRTAARRTGTDVDERLRLVLRTLDHPGQPRGQALVTATVEALGPEPDERVVWLVLGVVGGRFPTTDEVVAARRAAQLDGPAAVLEHAARLLDRRTAARRVHVARGETLVDLGDLVHSPLGTGIQRVARNVTAEWVASRDVRLVAWTDDFDAMRDVTPHERENVLQGVWSPPTTERSTRRKHVDDVVLPWECHYLLPELAVDPTRCAALAAMARHSPTTTGVIGFDCVPITSSETSAVGFAAVFSLNLAAVAHFDAVGAISGAAAREYEGWRRMLAGAGLEGPAVHAVSLPIHAADTTQDALDEARRRFAVPGMPMVLCVGSHEPRKNHLAVLHAAELLWRRGHRFALSFVGGASWGSREFSDRLRELQGAGRPVETVSRLPDRLLWAAYRIARFTVFPSVNEGFGLPVAESLAAGTPVITSDFGSMREIVEGGGALLVDPRDDQALLGAMERLLTDDALLTRLRDEAVARPAESWRDYADRLWDALHP